MKTVTAITYQQKNKQRCNIFLDGVYYCGLELSTVILNRIKVGMQIDENTLAEIQVSSERERAMDKAYSYISVSAKTEKQIRDYLNTKGYLAEVVDGVIEKLKEYDFINDGNYSVSYVRSASKSKGKRMIGYELKMKGVSQSEIEKALDGVENEAETAVQIARKYMRNKEVDVKNLHKCYSYLLSKGFGYDSAKSAVDSIKKTDDEQEI